MGKRGLPKVTSTIGRAPRRALPVFLIIFLALTFLSIPSVHATSQYVGYGASASGGSCGTNCESTGATTTGIGEVVRAPFTGQFVSAGIFVANAAPDRLVILTTASFGVTPYGCGSAGTCASANAPVSYTVQDVESLSGLSTGSFNTITLASPVTVTNGQAVAIVFMLTSSGTANIIQCACAAGAGQSTTGDIGFAFGTTSPSGNYNDGAGGGLQGVVGGTFQTVGSIPAFVSQCYGNCGSPAVTLANTNSTHLTNWNTSITQFYAGQSNVNGFVVNVTVPVARSYTNGNGLVLALYSVDPSCSTTPFTPQCPGFLQSSQTFTNPAKGNIAMLVHFAITNGQWIGIAVSGSFGGLDLNDTNTNVNLLQVAGRIPNQISSFTNLGNRLTGLYAWVQGNTITGGEGGGGAGCGTPQCGLNSFTLALGGGVFGGLAAFMIIFGLIIGFLFYVTRQHDAQGHIKGYAAPTWLVGIIALVLLFLFSAAGALPPYIPLVIMAVVAWLWASSIWSHRKNEGGTGAAM